MIEIKGFSGEDSVGMFGNLSSLGQFFRDAMDGSILFDTVEVREYTVPQEIP